MTILLVVLSRIFVEFIGNLRLEVRGGSRFGSRVLEGNGIDETGRVADGLFLQLLVLPASIFILWW
jgi:hypothetical protein